MTAAGATIRGGLGHDFLKFWVGQTISNLGTSVTLLAFPLIVFKLTGSALNLGLTAAVTTLPYLLFGLVIGAAVDRADRKRVMIAADIARAALIATVPLLAWGGALTVWWIYGVAFVSSALTIAFDSCEFAAVPSLVQARAPARGQGDGAPPGAQDALIAANGRIQASYSAAAVLGPLLAGALLMVLAVESLLVLDAASFLISAGSLALVRRRFNVAGAPRERANLRADIVEGLRYVLGHPVLRSISLMMALVNGVSVTVYAQLVLFADERLGAGASRVGLLYSAGSAGVIVLSLAAAPLRRRWSFSQVALGSLMLSGALTVALALTTAFWLALPILALTGGLGTLFNINTGSLRQAIVPNHLLGRIMSIAMVLATSVSPLGSLLGGVAIERGGDVALVYGVIGVLTVAIAAVFALGPLGRAERYLPNTAVEQIAERPV